MIKVSEISGLVDGLNKAATSHNYPNEFFWIGIIPDPKARKYKFEVLWFNGLEHYDNEEDVENQISNAESRMCEDLKQAYAYGFDALRKALKEEPELRVSITDLTKPDEEE